jgi:hypothetical protein
MMLSLRAFLLSFCACGIAACSWFRGPPPEPMPSMTIPARAASSDGRVVIVLPGRADTLEGLKASGIAEAIQDGDPGAEVVLVGATLAYYMDGGFVRRLHEQVVEPARARGASNIWLAGASMGGMGTLLYEHEHPGELRGLVLMAPYMGEKDLVREIAEAGGPSVWNPGPAPAGLTRDNAAREQWRLVKDWAASPAAANRVWLVCGSEDRFIDAARMIAPSLPQGHFLERTGGHAWKVWKGGASDVFQISRTQTAAVGGR